MPCKVLHSTCIRSQSNQALKSENSFSSLCIRKLVGQISRLKLMMMHYLMHIWDSRHGLARHSKQHRSLYTIPTAQSCLKVHAFRSNTFLASTIFRRPGSQLIKRWKWHFIPLSWNIFSFTSSLGGAGEGAGGFGLNFGFSITFFSGSGS